MRHPHLDVIVGDIANAIEVERVVNGQDVVLMALGAKLGAARTGVHAARPLNIVPAMQKFGVRRLINVSGIGTSESRANLERARHRDRERPARARPRRVSRQRDQDSLIRNSDLDWINVCPPWLTQGPRTGVYRFGVRPAPRRSTPRSRAPTSPTSC